MIRGITVNNVAIGKVNKKTVTAIILCAVIIFGIVAYDFINGKSSCEKTDVAMGTVVTLKLFGLSAKDDLERIDNEIDGLETSVLSWRKEGSDIYRINSGAGEFVSVSPDTVAVIKKCTELSEECGGKFDITVGPVTRLWDFGGDNQRLPEKSEIESALSNVDYTKIEISGNAVKIAEGQSVDLGAVGKGFACDRVRELLKNGKTKSAVISVGGSLLLYGKKTFTVGIVDPENDKASMGTLKLRDTCVSTSGDYEKFFEQDGKTYHHILNAKTGYPSAGEFKSVTVVCESGLLSDALSTVCFLVGYQKSIEILEKYDAEAVFIFKDKTVKTTDGLSGKLELTNDSYTVEK